MLRLHAGLDTGCDFAQQQIKFRSPDPQKDKPAVSSFDGETETETEIGQIDRRLARKSKPIINLQAFPRKR